jgi:SAM-dependent methyltransferase
MGGTRRFSSQAIYTTGEYLHTTETWHAEDSPWKAEQIARLVTDHGLEPGTIAEVGCGAGAVLDELSRMSPFRKSFFTGFDISPQAISLAQERQSARLEFINGDPLSGPPQSHYNLLLLIDVFEHVPDYLSFLERCRQLAEFTILHIPLDIHVSSVLRAAFVNGRYTIGHLHYFSAESALATLRDCGYQVVHVSYTNGAFGLFRHHPTLKRAIANVPRRLLSRYSVPLSARLFGGYSLLVLAK